MAQRRRQRRGQRAGGAGQGGPAGDPGEDAPWYQEYCGPDIEPVMAATSYQDFIGRYGRNCRILIPPTLDKSCEGTLKTLSLAGVRFQVSNAAENVGQMAHARARWMRHWALSSVVRLIMADAGRLWEAGEQDVVVELAYGSERERTLVRNALDTAVRYRRAHDLRVGDHREVISGGIVTAGDFRRARTDIQIGQVGAHIVLLNDVYWLGPDRALTPEALSRTWDLSSTSVHYMLHPFFGLFGTLAEMVWIRKDGLIHARPDTTGEAYAGHPPCDELLTAGHCSPAHLAESATPNVIWYTHALLLDEQPFYIVGRIIASAHRIAVGTPLAQRPVITEVVPSQFFRERLPGWVVWSEMWKKMRLGNEELTCHSDDLSNLMDKLNATGASEWTLQQALVAVQRVLSGTAWTRVQEVWYEDAQAYMQALLAIGIKRWAHRRFEFANMAHRLSNNVAFESRRLMKTFSSEKTPDEPVSWMWKAAAALSAAAVVVGFQVMRPAKTVVSPVPPVSGLVQDLDPEFWRDVVIAPIVEETIKEIITVTCDVPALLNGVLFQVPWSRAGLAFGCFESVLKGGNLYPILLHGGIIYGPYPMRILHHSVHNLLCWAGVKTLWIHVPVNYIMNSLSLGFCHNDGLAAGFIREVTPDILWALLRFDEVRVSCTAAVKWVYNDLSASIADKIVKYGTSSVKWVYNDLSASIADKIVKYGTSSVAAAVAVCSSAWSAISRWCGTSVTPIAGTLVGPRSVHEAFLSGEVLDVSDAVTRPPVSEFVVPDTAPVSVEPETDPTVVVKRWSNPVSKPYPQRNWHALLGHPIALCLPRVCYESYKSMIDRRIARKPPVEHTEEVDARWERLSAGPASFLISAVRAGRSSAVHMGNKDQCWQIWWQHLQESSPGWKWRIHHRTITQHPVLSFGLEMPDLMRAVDLMCKTDEVLVVEKIEDFRPRPIHNVHPTIAHFCGPEVYAFTQNLKTYLFCKEVRRNVYLTYGAGLVAEQYDAWFEFAIATEGMHIIAAGDDSLVWCSYRCLGGMAYIVLEGDIKQCDHSIRRGALRFQHVVMRAGGVSQQVLRALWASCSADMVVTKRFLMAKISRSSERNTGGVDTSVGNTIIVMAAWLYWLFHPEGLEPVAALMELGLMLELKVFEFDCESLRTCAKPTFLKGTWLACTNGAYAWTRLPSMALKQFKVSTDPRLICPRSMRKDHLACSKWVLGALCSGVVNHALAPGLREFVDKHALATHVDGSTLHRLGPRVWWRWIDRNVAPELDEEAAILSLAAHYKVEPEEYSSWARHLSSLTLFDMSWHPMWRVLALVDYF